MNRENLLKMADYIENIPQSAFDMRKFRADKNIDNEPVCNSVGCIIGHCTALDADNIEANFIKIKAKSITINFTKWSEHFTGLKGYSPTWLYLFGPMWIVSDNTSTGAAKRIRHFVKNGLPENWEDEMHGLKKLSYED